MGNDKKVRRPLAAAGVIGVASLTALTMGGPAFAAGGCGTIPAHAETVHHPALTKQVTHTTPGHKAKGYDEMRWSENVPAVPAVTHQESAFDRLVKGLAPVTQSQVRVDHELPGSPAVTHDEDQYDRTVKGTPAVTQSQVRVDHEIPASPAVTHVEDQYDRTVKGTPAVTQSQVRVDHEIPASPAVTHQENKYSRVVHLDVRYTYNKGSGPDDPSTIGSNPNTDPDHWQEDDKPYDGSPTGQYIHSGNGYGSWFWWIDIQSKQSTGWLTQPPAGDGWTVYDTRTVVDKPAVKDHLEWRTQNGGSTSDVSQAGWFPTSDLGTLRNQGWFQYGQPVDKVITPGTPDVTYYLVVSSNGTQSESTNKADASWVNPKVVNVGSQWTSFANRTVVDKPAVKDHLEWRTQNGGSTSDVSQAGWFPTSDLGTLRNQGWFQYGQPVDKVITPGTPDVTYYLVVSSNGTQSESTNKADASWVNPKVVNVGSQWTSFANRTVVDKPAVKDHLEWRTQNGGSTSDVSQAGWFPTSDLGTLRNQGWFQYGQPVDKVITPGTPDVTYYLVVSSNGTQSESTNKADASWVNPKVVNVGSQWTSFANRTVVDKPGKAGYTLYFSPKGQPTETLSNANWTTESPKGWKLVDEKFIVTTPATAPVTTHKTVVIKKAYDSTVTVPAKDKTCPAGTTGDNNGSNGNTGNNGNTPVAKTGMPDTGVNALPLELGGAGLLGLGGLVLWLSRRRRGAEQE